MKSINGERTPIQAETVSFPDEKNPTNGTSANGRPKKRHASRMPIYYSETRDYFLISF